MPNYGFWQGAERATGNMAATGLGLLEHKRKVDSDAAGLAIQQKRLDIAEESAGLQSRVAELTIAQKEKETQLIPVGEMLTKMGLSRPAEQELLMKYAGPYIQNGPASGLPTIQTNHAREVWGKILGDTGFNIEFSTLRARGAQEEIAAIDQEINSGMIESKKLEQLQARRNVLVTERTAADNFVKKLMGAKTPTTAIGAYLQNNPGASNDDIAEYNRSLSSSSLMNPKEDILSLNGAAYQIVSDEGGNKSLVQIGGGGAGEGEDPVFQKKIARLLKVNPGLSEQDATGLILNTKKVIQSPVTNERFLVDLISGEETKLKQEVVIGEGSGVNKPITTIYGLAGLATGPISAARQAGSVVSGMVGGPIAKKTARARQFVATATNELIRALSINPRFPVGEINRIKKEISLGSSVFDNPALFKQRALAIDEQLQIRLKNEDWASNDTSLPAETRKAARRSANDIRNFLKILGAPPTMNTVEEARKLEPGTKFIDAYGTPRVR